MNRFENFETTLIEINNIFDELGHEEGKHELIFLTAVFSLKQLDKIQKSRASFKQTTKRAGSNLEEAKSPQSSHYKHTSSINDNFFLEAFSPDNYTLTP